MSVFLGFIQGITEFLPISSSGHLSILQNLISLNYAPEEHLLFDVLLHIGTLASVIFAYRSDLKAMISDTAGALVGKHGTVSEDGRPTPSVRTVIFIVIATLMLVFVLPFKKYVETLYYNTPFIAFALIITGIILFVSGKLEEGKKSAKTITVKDAIIIGLSQALAIIPGLSRSGTTISVGLARGLKYEFAVKFSFLLSIPAVCGSALVTLISALRKGLNWSYVPAYLLGMVTAAVTGYFAITFLRKVISKRSFSGFAYYCWAVGIIALILSFIL